MPAFCYAQTIRKLLILACSVVIIARQFSSTAIFLNEFAQCINSRLQDYIDSDKIMETPMCIKSSLSDIPFIHMLHLICRSYVGRVANSFSVQHYSVILISTACFPMPLTLQCACTFLQDSFYVHITGSLWLSYLI